MTRSVSVKGLELGSGIPKICVPLISAEQGALYEEAETIKEAGTDFAEWRADYYKDLLSVDKTVDTLRKLTEILDGIPLIFTIRTMKEGGQASLAPADYIRMNEQAAHSHFADLIDVEIFGSEEEKKRLIRTIQSEGIPVIGSSHDFQKTDSCEELLSRFQKMERSGADILKLAVMPHTFEDVTALMNATHIMSSYTDRPIISMSMSALGSLSRFSGELYGSALTFGTVTAASAPVQVPVRTLRTILNSIHTL